MLEEALHDDGEKELPDSESLIDLESEEDEGYEKSTCKIKNLIHIKLNNRQKTLGFEAWRKLKADIKTNQLSQIIWVNKN